MRVGNNANQFFKTKAVQKDRLWVNLSNADGMINQALIGYTADATAGVDKFDAKYFSDIKIGLSSIVNNNPYTIQGRPSFDVADVVALQFTTDVTGDFSISLANFDGVFAAGQDIYLLDALTGSETNLKNGAYNFNTATTGVDNSRFTIKFQKTLKVDENVLANDVKVYTSNGTLKINSGKIAMKSAKVYDIQGRLIAQKNNIKNSETSFSNLKSKQVLIVKITSENNTEVSKKVLN